MRVSVSKSSILWMLAGVVLGAVGAAVFIQVRLGSGSQDDKIMAQLEELLADPTPVGEFEPIGAHELPPAVRDEEPKEAAVAQAETPAEPGCTDHEPPVADVVLGQPKSSGLGSQIASIFGGVVVARKTEPEPYVADPVPLEPEVEEGPMPRPTQTDEPPMAETVERPTPDGGTVNWSNIERESNPATPDRHYFPAFKNPAYPAAPAPEAAGPPLSAFDFPYIGNYAATLADSTVVLPEAVRQQLKGPNVLVVTAGTDQCLEVYPTSRLEQVPKEAEGKDSEQRKQQRLFYSRIAALRVRSDGSVQLPAHLVRYAGLCEAVVVIGVGDHFEIWDAQKWEEYQVEEMEPKQAGEPGHYLNHRPQYIPQSPAFPLPRELASQEQEVTPYEEQTAQPASENEAQPECDKELPALETGMSAVKLQEARPLKDGQSYRARAARRSPKKVLVTIGDWVEMVDVNRWVELKEQGAKWLAEKQAEDLRQLMLNFDGFHY